MRNAFAAVVMCLLRSVFLVDIQPEISFQRIEQTMGFDIYRNSIRITKFNRTIAVANGTADLFVDLDNSYTFQINLAFSRLGNNQFNLLPMRIPEQPFCDFYNGVYREYQDLFINTTNYPHVGSENVCPFPAGLYWNRNVLCDIDKIPSLPEGFYRVTILIKGKESTADFVIFAKLSKESFW